MRKLITIISLLITLVLFTACSAEVPEVAKQYGSDCRAFKGVMPPDQDHISCKVKVKSVSETPVYDDSGKITDIVFRINFHDSTPILDGKYSFSNCNLQTRYEYESSHTNGKYKYNTSHIGSCQNSFAEVWKNGFDITIREEAFRKIGEKKLNGPYVLEFIPSISITRHNFPHEIDSNAYISYSFDVSEVNKDNAVEVRDHKFIYHTNMYEYSDFPYVQVFEETDLVDPVEQPIVPVKKVDVDPCATESEVKENVVSVLNKPLLLSNKELCYVDIASNKFTTNVCDNFTDVSNKDYCHLVNANKSRDYVPCREIVDTDFKDECYMYAFVCKKVSDEKMDACYYNNAMRSGNSIYCSKIEDRQMGSDCHTDLITKGDDASLCEYLLDEQKITECLANK